MEKENNLYRIGMIGEILHEIHPSFPISLLSPSKSLMSIIEGYASISSLDNLHEQIMNKLQDVDIISPNSTNILDFDYYDFINRLYGLLPKKNEIPSSDSFWRNLKRYLFKWIIYMREKTLLNGENDAFEKISKDIEMISSIIMQEARLIFPSHFKFHNMDTYTIYIFENLINVEFFEYAHVLFPLFASATKYFYLEKQNEMTDAEENNFCKKWKSIFFGSSYDNNLLLKYLLAIHDPKGDMRKCIQLDDPHLEILIKYPRFSINSNAIDRMGREGPPGLEIPNAIYLNDLAMNFIIATDKKFKISNYWELCLLLKSLKEMGLLKREIIKRIIRFSSNGFKSPEWNQEKFKEYILESKKSLEHSHVKMECDEYLKLLD